MALKVKAVERLLKFDKNDPGSYRYVLKPELYTSLDQKKVIPRTALRRTVQPRTVAAPAVAVASSLVHQEMISHRVINQLGGSQLS